MNPFEEFLRRMFMQSAEPSGPTQQAQKKITKIEDRAKIYRDLIESPYVTDTLKIKSHVGPVLDNPAVYGEYDPSFNRINYNLDAPILADMPQGAYPADTYTARNVLTHETGHEKQELSPENFPAWASMYAPQFFADIPENARMSLRDIKKTKFSRADPDKRSPYRTGAVNIDIQNRLIDEPGRFLGFQLGRKERKMTPSEVAAFEALSPYYMFAGRSAIEPTRVIGTDAERFAQAFTNAIDFLARTSANTKGYRELIGRYEGNTPGMGGIVADLLERNPIYSDHPLHGLIRSNFLKEKKNATKSRKNP